VYYRTPYARIVDIDMGSMEIDFKLVKSGMIHSRSLETDFGSVERGMTHSWSFLLHYFFMAKQSRTKYNRDVRDGIDWQMIWHVEFFLVEREC